MISRTKDKNSFRQLCEDNGVVYSTLNSFKSKNKEKLSNMSDIEIIQYWKYKHKHLKRGCNKHLFELAKQHGISEETIGRYKYSCKGLTDEQVVERYIKAKNRISFRDKCRNAGINITNAEYYRQHHPELTDEQVIDWYKQRNGKVGRWASDSESLHSLCKKYEVNYQSAIAYRKHNSSLSNEQIIIHYRPDLRLNIFGEIIQ